MERAIPHLRILSYIQAVSFYVDKLGFDIAFEWRNGPDEPVYLGIRSGEMLVHLSEYEASGPAGGGRGMTLSVHDIDAWNTRLKMAGVVFERELQAQEWGSKDFIVHDPFANTIVITSSE